MYMLVRILPSTYFQRPGLSERSSSSGSLVLRSCGGARGPISDKQTDERYTDRLTDREAERKAHRQTERQKETDIDRHRQMETDGDRQRQREQV